MVCSVCVCVCVCVGGGSIHCISGYVEPKATLLNRLEFIQSDSMLYLTEELKAVTLSQEPVLGWG